MTGYKCFVKVSIPCYSLFYPSSYWNFFWIMWGPNSSVKDANRWIIYASALFIVVNTSVEKNILLREADNRRIVQQCTTNYPKQIINNTIHWIQFILSLDWLPCQSIYLSIYLSYIREKLVFKIKFLILFTKLMKYRYILINSWRTGRKLSYDLDRNLSIYLSILDVKKWHSILNCWFYSRS